MSYLTIRLKEFRYWPARIFSCLPIAIEFFNMQSTVYIGIEEPLQTGSVSQQDSNLRHDPLIPYGLLSPYIPSI